MAERKVTICGEAITGSAHVCAFFNSRSEEDAIVIPYLREGLDRGERVVGIVEGWRRDARLSGLRDEGVAVDAALAAGELEVLTPDQTYLKTGEFDPQEMFVILRELLSSAKHEGRAVRTCGSMDCLSRSNVSSEKVLEYESQVNLFTRDHDCTLLCVYDLALISDALMADIISTHPYVVMNQRLRSNPHYIEPEVYIDEVLRPRITEKARMEQLPRA